MERNAYAESFVGTVKRECLNYFTCFAKAQVGYIVEKFVSFYNTYRPHRGKGIDNRVLDPSFVPKRAGPVKCEEFLGGLLKSYYRDVG